MTNNKKIKRFYIMPAVWRTVSESQVFNWIELINEAGLSTDCISISKKSQSKENIKKIERSLKGRFYQYYLLPDIISDLYQFVIFFYHYLVNFFYYDKIIFQTRIPRIGSVLSVLRLFPKVRIILELRGAKLEERKYQISEKSMSLKLKLKEGLMEFNIKLFLKRADAVFCVSEALKKYFISIYIANEKKMFVFPGVADYKYFFYSNEIRNDYRNKLKYSNEDIVIVYSGALGMKWEIPEQVFKFMKDLISINKNYKFLIITPDVDLAHKYSKEYGIFNFTTVLISSFQNVNNYLNAADIGLLLREKALMNQVASPTKFSEYILAGLPVILSDSIDDFTQIIRNTGYGLVLENHKKININDSDAIIKLCAENKEEISNWGNLNFSKGIFIQKYIDILSSI